MNNIMPFESNNAPAKSGGTVSEMMVSRQAQEVQAAMVVAKRFPRNENDSWNRIMRTCQRQTLAEQAMYEFPRGKEKVSGPSIRLAEAIAQNWGNIDFGFIELENKNGESQVMAYCWDLETNTRQSKVFTVPHIRATKNGNYALTDPRDIYEMVANQAARRVRSCILSIIPGDVVDAAVKVCQQTLLGGDPTKVHEKVQSVLDVFRTEFEIPQQAVERFIGCKASAFTAQTILRLRGVYTAIKEGRATVADFFEKPAGAVETKATLPAAEKPVGELADPDSAAGDGNGPKQVSMNDL